MKTLTSSLCLVFRSTTRLLLPTLLIFALTGCADSLTGIDEGGEPSPRPEPTLTKLYKLNLTTRYIHIKGSCDTDLLGNPANGEFQWKYEVSYNGSAYSRESKNYNSVAGQSYSRRAGENINFSNQTYSWRDLQQTDGFRVKLFGAEWDGALKDDRMKNRSGSREVPYKKGKDTHEVIIGANTSCQIRLVYDAEWIEYFQQN